MEHMPIPSNIEFVPEGFDMKNVPKGIQDGFGTEFIAENFGPFKGGMETEEGLKVVPSKNSKTSKMNDPPPPNALRVKSGYTGHVPHGRDFIGGSYKHHDNRGTSTKHRVPVVTSDGKGRIDKSPPKAGLAALMCHDPFSSKPGDIQHDYGVTTTAPVAARVEKVLAGDHSDISDDANREAAHDTDGAGQWIMSGYTGHVPKSREVYATSFYGPPEGPSYHGPYYASDKYTQPMSPNKESISP